MRAICLTRLGRKAEAEKSLAEVDAFLATIPRPLAEPRAAAPRGRDRPRAGRPRRGPRGPREGRRASRPSTGSTMDAGPVEIQYALARTALEEGETGRRRARRSRASSRPGPPAS